MQDLVLHQAAAVVMVNQEIQGLQVIQETMEILEQMALAQRTVIQVVQDRQALMV
jgi:hypothetical protein